MYNWLNPYIPREHEEMMAMMYVIGIGVGFGVPLFAAVVVIWAAMFDYYLPINIGIAILVLGAIHLMYFWTAGFHISEYWYEKIDPRNKHN